LGLADGLSLKSSRTIKTKPQSIKTSRKIKDTADDKDAADDKDVPKDKDVADDKDAAGDKDVADDDYDLPCCEETLPPVTKKRGRPKKAAKAASKSVAIKKGGPQKQCPECGASIHIRKRSCPSCDYTFGGEMKKPRQEKTSDKPRQDHVMVRIKMIIKLMVRSMISTRIST